MENPTQQPAEQTTVAPEEKKITINQGKLDAYMAKLRLEQNLTMGILGGVVVAIIGAILWAMITVSTGYQIGYMALAIGLGVGFTMRATGKGIDKIFGITGAILAFFGCLLGNILSIIGFAANSEGLGYMETLSLIDFSLIPSIMMDTFSPMDLLFYGIAIYEGYKFSFRQITEEEIITNAADSAVS